MPSQHIIAAYFPGSPAVFIFSLELLSSDISRYFSLDLTVLEILIFHFLLLNIDLGKRVQRSEMRHSRH